MRDEYCISCKRTLNAWDFYIRKDKRLGRTSRCKECVSAYNRAYYLKNQDDLSSKSREYMRSLRKEHCDGE